jgi:hypothetical protein
MGGNTASAVKFQSQAGESIFGLPMAGDAVLIIR